MSAASPTGFESVTGDDAIKQGIIAAALGGSALIARQLMSEDKASWGYLLRSGIAAMVTAYFMNQLSKSYVQDENLRVCICGLAGFAAPEIQRYGLLFIKAKLQSKVQSAQAELKPVKPRKPKTKKGKKDAKGR
jgi:hypothetical protein